MSGIMCLSLFGSLRAEAFPWCAYTYMCFWMDVQGFASGLLLRATTHKLKNAHYDVTPGLEKIKENIGMKQGEGKCGRSATGNTGCDLTTEEGAAEDEKKLQEMASSTPDTVITLINQEEKGDLFNDARSAIGDIVFVQDDNSLNEDCVCSAGTGSACNQSECAQTRQNDSLVRSTTVAQATADMYLAKMDGNYEALVDLVQQINEEKTLNGFVGGIGSLSVHASSLLPEMMLLYAEDLRAQSYRNLVSAGIEEVDLSTLSTEGD